MKRKLALPKMTLMEKKKSKWAYIFLLPWFVHFCVFYAYPLVYGFVISFTNFDLSGKMDFIWLDNFKSIFADYKFWRSFAGMLRYAVIILPLNVFIPLWAANTLHPHGKKMQSVSKLLIYLPGVLCSVALIIVWKFMLAPSTGFVSQWLKEFGFKGSLFDNANYSIPVLSLLIVFSGLGGNLIIFSSAMNGISSDYYDAAELDGANRRQQFFHITIPLLRPTLLYVLITGTIGAFQIFTVPKLMTAGGPNYSSSTLLMLLYDSAFVDYKFGYAAALGVIIFIFTAAIAIVQFRTSGANDSAD